MPKFRLETALKVRERLEKLYQKALAEQVQVEQQLHDRKRLMVDALQNHQKELDQAKEQGVTLDQLIMGDHFQQRIQQQMQITDDQLREQQQVVALKRHELTQATQKKRVLEILKEKEKKRFLEKQERLERLEADEIAQNLKRHSLTK